MRTTFVFTSSELISSTFAIGFLTIFLLNKFQLMQCFPLNCYLRTGFSTGISSPCIAMNSCPSNFFTLRYASVISPPLMSVGNCQMFLGGVFVFCACKADGI